MRSLLDDLRLAVRALAMSPGCTTVVVLTLGVSSGVTTAVYSVVDGVLLRPLPCDRPEQLVRPTWDRTVRAGWPSVTTTGGREIEDRSLAEDGGYFDRDGAGVFRTGYRYESDSGGYYYGCEIAESMNPSSFTDCDGRGEFEMSLGPGGHISLTKGTSLEVFGGRDLAVAFGLCAIGMTHAGWPGRFAFIGGQVIDFEKLRIVG